MGKAYQVKFVSVLARELAEPIKDVNTDLVFWISVSKERKEERTEILKDIEFKE